MLPALQLEASVYWYINCLKTIFLPRFELTTLMQSLFCSASRRLVVPVIVYRSSRGRPVIRQVVFRGGERLRTNYSIKFNLLEGIWFKKCMDKKTSRFIP